MTRRPYAGVDLCWLHYLDLMRPAGRSPVAPLGRDFRHIVLRSDALCRPADNRCGRTDYLRKDIVRSYRPPLAFSISTARDWRYSVETLLVVSRSVVACSSAPTEQRGAMRTAATPVAP